MSILNLFIFKFCNKNQVADEDNQAFPGYLAAGKRQGMIFESFFLRTILW